MTDWPNWLNDAERADLADIDRQRAQLKARRDTLMNRAKLRRHRNSPPT